MTTQPQAGDMRPQAGVLYAPQPGDSQFETGESKESKTPGGMTGWPRDLTDLWGSSAFRGNELAVPRHQGRRIHRWRAAGGRAEAPGSILIVHRGVGRQWRPDDCGGASGKQPREARQKAFTVSSATGSFVRQVRASSRHVTWRWSP